MATHRAHRALTAACACALAALGLMTWQLFDPRVVPVLVAMTVGQILGTAAFAAYLIVVVLDVRARLRAARDERKI